MRILLIGAGAIGSTLARAADAMDDVESLFVMDARADVADALAASCRKAEATREFDAALAASDLVVEAASQAAVAEFGPRALEAGRDFVVVSVGALADDALRARLEAAARATRRRVFVPSGAIGGLDALKAAREAGLARVSITTAKPPAGLGRDGGAEARVLFEGSARRAVREFPKNVNVAAALSLAGVGFDETRVRVVADPSLARNTHVVEAEGDFGRLRMSVENEPFPANPATSYLAALSVVALVRRLASPIDVGT